MSKDDRRCDFCHRYRNKKFITGSRFKFCITGQEGCEDLRKERIEKDRANEIDETMDRYNGYKFKYKNGDLVKLETTFFNCNKWIVRRFSFSSNKIYKIVDDGIFDDNNKFLDFNIQSIEEISFENGVGTFKIMIPFILWYLFETERYCRNWREKTGDLGCRECKPIAEYYYNKSFHGMCASCFELRKNEKRKNKLFMAFINQQKECNK